jgi:hypothetical protein
MEGGFIPAIAPDNVSQVKQHVRQILMMSQYIPVDVGNVLPTN